jgi:hypothetical protein
MHCRTCFKVIDNKKNSVKFHPERCAELLQIDFASCSSVEMKICKICDEEFKRISKFKQEVIETQKKFAILSESIVELKDEREVLDDQFEKLISEQNENLAETKTSRKRKKSSHQE